MNIETWECKEKHETEIQHFLDNNGASTYVFGMNVDLLGRDFYNQIKEQIEDRLSILKHSPWSFAKQ
jgi:hypothetical protein